MLENRLLVLDLVEDGKISVPEAVELIESINIDDLSNGVTDDGQAENEIVIHLYIE